MTLTQVVKFKRPMRLCEYKWVHKIDIDLNTTLFALLKSLKTVVAQIGNVMYRSFCSVFGINLNKFQCVMSRDSRTIMAEPEKSRMRVFKPLMANANQNIKRYFPMELKKKIH